MIYLYGDVFACENFIENFFEKMDKSVFGIVDTRFLSAICMEITAGSLENPATS